MEPEPGIAERQSGHVEVWSATLFPYAIGGSLGCSDGGCSAPELSDNDFEYDGASYTVTAVTLATDGTLEIDVSATPTADTIADLVLNVDARNVFRLSDATVTGSALSWASTGLDLDREPGRRCCHSTRATGRRGSARAGNREVPENSPAGTDVGAPVTATELDGDTLTYTLEGTEAASFDIVSSTGQIQTISGVAYDFETKRDYFVTVKADDGNGGTDTASVYIELIDVDEPPAAPAAPTVTPVTGSSDSLDVSWIAPTTAASRTSSPTTCNTARGPAGAGRTAPRTRRPSAPPSPGWTPTRSTRCGCGPPTTRAIRCGRRGHGFHERVARALSAADGTALDRLPDGGDDQQHRVRIR